MSDLISREMALDEIHKCLETRDYTLGSLYDAFCDMPSAEPEIIRCGDCKHCVRDDVEEYTPYGFYNTYFRAFCDKHWDEEQGEYIDVKIDDFCSWAERRTDETD